MPLTATPTVFQIPFHPDLSTKVETTSPRQAYDGSNFANNGDMVHLGVGTTIYDNPTIVTLARTGNTASINPTTGQLSLSAANIAAFGDVGLQVSQSRTNLLSTSNMDIDGGGGVPISFLQSVTPGPATIITTQAIVPGAGPGYSNSAIHYVVNNTTGSTQTITLFQGPFSGTLNQWFSAQARVKIVSQTNVTGVYLTVHDVQNAISQNTPSNLSNLGNWQLVNSSLQLTVGASTNLRWEMNAVILAGGTLEFYITNSQLASDVPWTTHYVPSAAGPTLRGADVVNVTNSWYTPANVWTIDFRALAPLNATVPNASQLMYLFSSYNGTQGSSIFMNTVNTLTWRIDNSGVFTDLTLTSTAGGPLGLTPWRVWFISRPDPLPAVTFNRMLALERLDSGVLVTPVTSSGEAAVPFTGTTLKLGRDNTDANNFEGFIGRFTYWGARSNVSLSRTVNGWPFP
jgi:hypothetical protein